MRQRDKGGYVVGGVCECYFCGAENQISNMRYYSFDGGYERYICIYCDMELEQQEEENTKEYWRRGAGEGEYK